MKPKPLNNMKPKYRIVCKTDKNNQDTYYIQKRNIFGFWRYIKEDGKELCSRVNKKFFYLVHAKDAIANLIKLENKKIITKTEVVEYF